MATGIQGTFRAARVLLAMNDRMFTIARGRGPKVRPSTQRVDSRLLPSKQETIDTPELILRG